MYLPVQQKFFSWCTESEQPIVGSRSLLNNDMVLIFFRSWQLHWGKNCKHFTRNTFIQVFFIAESDYEDDLDDFSSNDDDDDDDDDDYDGEDSDLDDGKKKSKSKAKKAVKSPKATKGKTNSTKTTKPAAASSKAASKSGGNAKTLFLRFVLHIQTQNEIHI